MYDGRFHVWLRARAFGPGEPNRPLVAAFQADRIIWATITGADTFTFALSEGGCDSVIVMKRAAMRRRRLLCWQNTAEAIVLNNGRAQSSPGRKQMVDGDPGPN